MGASRFYAALAALLFTAACAWFGAAVFRPLTQAPEQPEAPASSAAIEGRVQGRVLRWEQSLPEAPTVSAAPGDRLSAADTGSESALFFPDTDGLEYLTPEAAQPLTPEVLDELLAAASQDSEGVGRLVFGRELFAAVFWAGDAVPVPGRCTLTLESGERLRACLVSVSADAEGRTALLLRLPLGTNALLTERFFTGLLIQERD